ncbi:MAG: lycopene cyclase family protein [Saprospiraceae bacterium]
MEEKDVLHITGTNKTYTANLVFDSRIPTEFFNTEDPYTRLLQHFRGWVVRTPEDRFDPDNFTMMDFRLQWPGTTSFTYVLPFTKREALIEFTLFTPSLLQQDDYEKMLRRYCQEILAIHDFDILEIEQGVIPMSDFPFNRYSTDRQLKIGTAGGWVKPSSGYSFKNCEKNAQQIVDNLKQGRPVGHGLHRSRFRWYDSIFLNVLNRRNDLGPGIFSDMYFKNDIQKIFAFLDEESSILDDIKMFQKFPKRLFLKSLLHHISR